MEYIFNKLEHGIACHEIIKLLELKVIKERHRQIEQIISPIFLRKEKDCGFWLGISVEKLNRLTIQTFQSGKLKRQLHLLIKVITWPHWICGMLTTLFALTDKVKYINSHAFLIVFLKAHNYSLN